MSLKPLVSVGMPVYNGERYLKQALESITIQDYENLEIIISDNGSTDRTLEICQEYVHGDPRVRLYRNEQNVGAAGNFSRAFELSAGKYFFWAAHDDLWKPSYVSTCVEVLERLPTAALCCARLNQIDEDGEVLTHIKDNFEITATKPAGRIKQLLLHPTPWFAVCGLIRSDVLRKCRALQKVWGSDVVLLTEICLLGKIKMVDEELFSYRVYRTKSFADTMHTIDPASKEKAVLPLWRDLSREIFRAIRSANIKSAEKASAMVAAAYALSLRWRTWIKEDLDRRYHPRYVKPALKHLEQGERRAAAANLIPAMLRNPFYFFSSSMWGLVLQIIFGRGAYAAARRLFHRLFPWRA